MSNTTFQPRKSAHATLTHVICVTENIAEKVSASLAIFSIKHRFVSLTKLSFRPGPQSPTATVAKSIHASTRLDARAHRRRKCHDAWLNFCFAV